MRLTPDEARAIKRCANDVFGVDREVSLFGSRVDDTKRGGDIDLSVVADKAALADELSFKRVQESALGERGVDVVLRRRGVPPSRSTRSRFPRD